MESIELAELRRRAYGPEADIWDDADATARLAELEQLSRQASAPGTTTALKPAAPSASIAPPVGDGPIPLHGVASTEGEPHATEPTAVSAGGSRRATVIAAGIAVALVMGVAASTLVAGPTVVTLHQRAAVPPAAAAQLNSSGELRYMHIRPEDVRLYDEYEGVNVWSARRGTNTTCLFVTSSTPPRWRVDCAPSNGEPTLDLVRYRDGSRLSGLEAIGDVPAGSVLRLVLRNGTVVVRTVQATTMGDPQP